MSKTQNNPLSTTDDFLKANFLPNNYNTIEEYGDSLILLKNTQLSPKFSFPFKEILIVFGQDEEGKFRIHSIHYPKKSYSMNSVRKIAKSTLKCKYCIEGENVLFPYDISESYLNPNPLKFGNDRNNDLEETKKMLPIFQTLKSEARGAFERPFKTVENIAEAGVDTVLKPVEKFFDMPNNITFADFMTSGFLTAIVNNLIDIQPTAGGQALGYGITILGTSGLALALNKFGGLSNSGFLMRQMKLLGMNLSTNILPAFIPGAKYDAGFLDDAIGDIQGAIKGIMGGYGIKETIGNLFDFGFNFGSYLPFVEEGDSAEIIPQSGGLAKIQL